MRRGLARVLLAVSLAGCAGTIHTPDGDEPIRSALWFDPAAVGADASQTLVVLANSPLPCAPEDVADDPSTGTDEAAAAAAYWQAELDSAVAREGAWVVVAGLVTGDADRRGAYPLDPAGLRYPTAGLGPRGGFGAYAHVVESAVTATDGLVSDYAITAFDSDFGQPPSVVTIDADDGDTLSGALLLLPARVSAEFAAQRCTNTDLQGVILQRALNLVIIVPVGRAPADG